MPMHADNFSLTDYFHRIDYSGTPKADIETVARMMRRQLFSVPFENLDVRAGKIVSLVPEEIVDEQQPVEHDDNTRPQKPVKKAGAKPKR